MAKRTPPNTIANLSGGNQPASLLDANFAAPVYGDTAVTQWNIPTWGDTAGQYATFGLPTIPANGTIVKVVGVDINNKLPAVDGSQLLSIPPGVVRSYLAGLILSNDGVTPNSILDVAAGTCADSTNAVMINLGAFTKKTGGSWTSGTGQNGMGVGLTIAINTWYHVFAIINNAAADVYFDTSVSAANAPVGTTAFRRIGSFKTDGSANILTFTQDGDYFVWKASVLDVSDTNPGTSAVTKTLASVPTGVNVQAILNSFPLFNTSATALLLWSDLSANDEAPSTTITPLNTGAADTLTGGYAVSTGRIIIRTNTSAQVRYRISASGASDVVRAATLGWYDRRGRDS